MSSLSTDITVTVNGRPVAARVDCRRVLSDFLRKDCSLTGVRVGCEHGVCGACTVVLDGRTARSCCLLAVQADGAEVDTVEGMAERGRLHPLQEAFWRNHGLQCGFCTPGILMVARELLRDNPDPSDREIREALAGTICRCTGYQFIVDAIKEAAQMLRADPDVASTHGTCPASAAQTLEGMCGGD
jgi:carbon-monoxide dehydrogenase small subunit